MAIERSARPTGASHDVVDGGCGESLFVKDRAGCGDKQAPPLFLPLRTPGALRDRTDRRSLLIRHRFLPFHKPNSSWPLSVTRVGIDRSLGLERKPAEGGSEDRKSVV